MMTDLPTSNQIVSENEIEQGLSDSPIAENEESFPKVNLSFGLILALIGYVFFLLGARPSLFGLDRSRVIGFVQISVFLTGLGLISFGSYMALNTFWTNGKKTILAQIGARLISTGYVICVFAGMADIFGLGSHPLPNVFFGPLQAQGMGFGMVTIAVGLLLLIRYRRDKNKSEPAQAAGDSSDEEKPGS